MFNQAKNFFSTNQSEEVQTSINDTGEANAPIRQTTDENCQIKNMEDTSYKPKLIISPGSQQGFTLYRETVSGLQIRAGKDYEYSDKDGVFNIIFKNKSDGLFSETSQIKLSKNCYMNIKYLDTQQTINYIYSRSITSENSTEDRYKLASLLAESIQNNYNVEVEEYQTIEAGKTVSTTNNINAIVDIFQFKANKKIYTGVHAMYTNNGYVVFSTFIYPATLIKTNGESSDLGFIEKMLEGITY
ncbi:MAG: hypothetical protein KBC87_02245 [Candidatus Pacebacteria bacterium]|nr:hypothetical protein [Candidatus Paceibacterota bacterium]